MEYATKEQAQNAVATLSNQSLMGRLVYVREVCLPISSKLYRAHSDLCRRTANQSPDLSDQRVEVAAASVAARPHSTAALAVALAAARFMSLTFVSLL